MGESLIGCFYLSSAIELKVALAKFCVDKTGFLLELLRNMWYNVKYRIINSKTSDRGAKWQ